MAIADASIDPRILKFARQEFLKNGYLNASLRAICKNAGVTTGALYNRFSGKAELFSALVQPVIDNFSRLGEHTESDNYEALEENQMQVIWDMSEETHKKWMVYFYEQYDELKLLLCYASGSKHEHFLDDFVRINTKSCLVFAQAAKDKGLTDRVPDEDELHILLTAYWSCIFEPIAHDFSLEKALKYCGTITRFFNWQAIFGF